MLLVVLTSCASAAAPASKPVPAVTAQADTLPPLDGEGQREMLAGFELELGDERAKTAAANQRAYRAEIGAVIGTVLGLILGASIIGATNAVNGHHP